jgi:hypothetical protein
MSQESNILANTVEVIASTLRIIVEHSRVDNATVEETLAKIESYSKKLDALVSQYNQSLK